VSKKPRYHDALSDARIDLLRDLHNAAGKVDDPALFLRLRQRLEADVLNLNAWRWFPQPTRWVRWLAVKQAHSVKGARLVMGPDGAFAVASTALRASNDPAAIGPAMMRRDYEAIEAKLAKFNKETLAKSHLP
jgi:hypothetical protein